MSALLLRLVLPRVHLMLRWRAVSQPRRRMRHLLLPRRVRRWVGSLVRRCLLVLLVLDRRVRWCLRLASDRHVCQLLGHTGGIGIRLGGVRRSKRGGVVRLLGRVIVGCWRKFGRAVGLGWRRRHLGRVRVMRHLLGLRVSLRGARSCSLVRVDPHFAVPVRFGRGVVRTRLLVRRLSLRLWRRLVLLLERLLLVLLRWLLLQRLLLPLVLQLRLLVLRHLLVVLLPLQVVLSPLLLGPARVRVRLLPLLLWRNLLLRWSRLGLGVRAVLLPSWGTLLLLLADHGLVRGGGAGEFLVHRVQVGCEGSNTRSSAAARQD